MAIVNKGALLAQESPQAAVTALDGCIWELEKTDVALEESHANFTETGLKVSSTIRLHRLITISIFLIRRELGRLPEDMRILVDQKLKQLFNLG